MNMTIFGRTAFGIPIPAYHLTPNPSPPSGEGEVIPEILVIGGVHGDEIEGSICAHGIAAEFPTNQSVRVNLTLVPTLNLDGLFARSRVNGNGVDLNRNLPTNDWNPKAFNERYPPGPSACSEPENQALVKYLDEKRPQLIISIHSFHQYMMNINGNCEAAAKAMQAINRYPIEESIGYPTPGCLGTYAGLERGMPTITYEIERGISTTEILKTHVAAVMAAIATVC